MKVSESLLLLLGLSVIEVADRPRGHDTDATASWGNTRKHERTFLRWAGTI